MKYCPLHEQAYNLHTLPSRSSWNKRVRKFIGIVSNLESDLIEIERIIDTLSFPRFDFVGSCIKSNSIGIRIFDEGSTIRMTLDSWINPEDIKKWLLEKWLPQEFNNAPFSLNPDYSEKISARIFRILVPAYDTYIKLRYSKDLKKG